MFSLVRKRLALSCHSLCFFSSVLFSSGISWYRSNRVKRSRRRAAPEPFFSRGPSTCPSAWFSLSAGSNPWTSKNENHHTGVKHRLKKGHKNETHVYEHRLIFFPRKKRGGLRVAAEDVVWGSSSPLLPSAACVVWLGRSASKRFLTIFFCYFWNHQSRSRSRVTNKVQAVIKQ
jgi:hypothetical protein